MGVEANLGFLERLSVKPGLESLGVHPGQEHADSGSGTTVYRVNQFPFGECALKVFDLHGSEHMTLQGVESYRTLTNRIRKDVAGFRDDLLWRTFTADDGSVVRFDWSVNPIKSVGLVRAGEGNVVPYTISPWVKGISLGDLFSYPETVVGTGYEWLTTSSATVFLREEFHRFDRLLRWEYTHEKIGLIHLNVLASAKPDGTMRLVITNLREYVDPRKNPLGMLRMGR